METYHGFYVPIVCSINHPQQDEIYSAKINWVGYYSNLKKEIPARRDIDKKKGWQKHQLIFVFKKDDEKPKRRILYFPDAKEGGIETEILNDFQEKSLENIVGKKVEIFIRKGDRRIIGFRPKKD